MRKTFVDVVSAVFAENTNCALFLGDIGVFGFRKVLEEHPLRAFNIGILEQSMIGVASGYAYRGVIPIVHTIAPFMVERALEQIKIDFGYQELPGNFVSVGASFDYAALGCTHHCPADVNILSNVPGARIFIPGTALEFREQFEKNWNNGCLNYFRLSEEFNSTSNIEAVSGPTLIKGGSEATVIAIGPTLDLILSATSDMNVQVLYLNNLVKNELYLDPSFCPSKKLIVIEPYYSGAFLQLISDTLSNNAIRVLQVGVPKNFSRNYGSSQDHFDAIGFSPKLMREKMSRFING